MQVQGIITGIGDRENNINVITPQVDAAVRHHILGHYEIIDGLNIVTENGVPVLKKGSCVLCGYQGTLTQDIQLDPTVDKYIYGRFRIYFSENINDSFSVLVVNYNASGSTVDPTVINNEFNDYLLRLYTYNDSLGEYVISSHLDTALDFQYLKKVYSADMAEVLQNGGTIASNVTATTQSINDNSTKVATTEYVHNQIEEEIAYDTSSGILAHASNYVITYTAKRKAKYVILDVLFSYSENSGINIGTGVSGSKTISGIPEGFRPKTTKDCGIKQLDESEGAWHCITSCIINSNGEIILSWTGDGAYAPIHLITPILINAGYETN